MKSLAELLDERVVICDGAMGTALVERGLSPDSALEAANLERPELVKELHSAYVEAGADVVETNTFGANRYKLARHGLEDKVSEICRAGVQLAREATQGRALVLGSIGSLGKLLSPLGPLSVNEASEAFAEQARVLAEAGVDGLILETFVDLYELRLALLACKAVCDLPIVAQGAFDAEGLLLRGATPELAVEVLSAAGALVVGANCGTGPEGVLAAVQAMGRECDCYLSGQPNAGFPQRVDGRTIYRTGPQYFAEAAERLVEAGANLVGGCCGTTPEHIAAVAQRVKGARPQAKRKPAVMKLAGTAKLVKVGPPEPVVLVGERLNPTNRPKLTEDLKTGRFAVVKQEARLQVEQEAAVLDLNLFIPGCEEAELFAQAVPLVQGAVEVPLSLDTSSPEAAERALQVVAGKPILNSINLTPERLEQLLPLAVKYGAAVVGLTLDEKGRIPASAEERAQLAERLVERVEAAGLSRRDLIIDPLVMPAGTAPENGQVTLEAIRLVHELGLPVWLGLSNVSHGMPLRAVLNAAFASAAVTAGADALVMNPAQEEVKKAVRAAEALAGRDEMGLRFLAYFRSRSK